MSPLLDPNFLFLMQFPAKFDWPNDMLATPFKGGSPVWEILDPPGFSREANLSDK